MGLRIRASHFPFCQWICGFRSYFPLVPFFQLSFGIAIFPGGQQIWFISLCKIHLGHNLNPEPFKGTLQSNLNKTTQVKIGSSILLSSQTCSPALLLSVSLSHLVRRSTGCTVQQTAVLGRNWQKCDLGEQVGQAPSGDQVHLELLQGPATGYEGWYRSKPGLLFTARKDRQQLCFWSTTAEEQNHKSISK